MVSTSLHVASATGGEIWISTGYNRGAGGAAATWAKTLTMAVGANAVNWYAISPPVHHHDDLPDDVNPGILAVGEYGNQADSPRKVYASEDHGRPGGSSTTRRWPPTTTITGSPTTRGVTPCG
jgi:hypothetical protein